MCSDKAESGRPEGIQIEPPPCGRTSRIRCQPESLGVVVFVENVASAHDWRLRRLIVWSLSTWPGQPLPSLAGGTGSPRAASFGWCGRRASGYGIRGSVRLILLASFSCMRPDCRRRTLPNGLAGARVQCGIVCAGWGEREQRKVAFLERRRLASRLATGVGQGMCRVVRAPRRD